MRTLDSTSLQDFCEKLATERVLVAWSANDADGTVHLTFFDDYASPNAFCRMAGYDVNVSFVARPADERLPHGCSEQHRLANHAIV